MTRASLLIVGALALWSCTASPPAPARLDTRHETCRFCRMHVSDRHFAAQLVAPGEEPLFFDDLGCLAGYLKGREQGPRGERAYVADHLSGTWIEVGGAVLTRAPSLATPMGSHLVAHADAASRDADPAAAGGEPQTVADVFGGRLPAGDRR